MTHTPSPYAARLRSERIADAVVHVLGLCFAVAGAVAVVVWTVGRMEGARGAAGLVYAAALLATFAASALYHLAPWDRLRGLLRRLDHAAIFLKIAGTATPFAALAQGALAWAALGALWALALGGAVAKMAFWRDPDPWGTALYLALGWMGALVLWPATLALPTPAIVLAAAGGLLYTLGTVFFLWESLRFSTAIWHGFVLAASGCFFAAVAWGPLA